MDRRNLRQRADILSKNPFRARPARLGKEMTAAPCAGHLRGARALRQLRAPMASLRFRFLKARRRMRHSFENQSDWMRIVMLGVILLQLAFIAFTSNMFDGVALEYVPGTANMVAGVLSWYILVRIARPKMHFDWLLEALLQLISGSIVALDHNLNHAGLFVTNLSIFIALIIIRLWIALTIFPRRGFAALAAGAGTTAFIACWLLATEIFSIPPNPDIMLATDLAIRALSLITFGLTLRK